MIHCVYIISIIVITIFVLIYYFIKKNEQQKELRKIDAIEAAERNKNEELERRRSMTTPCPYGNFTGARECYFGSDNKCSWNIRTRRCELK